jgi:hypothetical protein
MHHDGNVFPGSFVAFAQPGQHFSIYFDYPYFTAVGKKFRIATAHTMPLNANIHFQNDCPHVLR